MWLYMCPGFNSANTWGSLPKGLYVILPRLTTIMIWHSLQNLYLHIHWQSPVVLRIYRCIYERLANSLYFLHKDIATPIIVQDSRYILTNRRYLFSILFTTRLHTYLARHFISFFACIWWRYITQQYVTNWRSLLSSILQHIYLMFWY